MIVARSLWLIPCALLAPCFAWSSDPLPYHAIVSTPSAPVRSGPGKEFYATGRLRRGETVAVYRIKDSGWCAIRPPAGSFSYVRADAVRLAADGQHLVVTREGEKTRVGSQFGSQRHVQYVSLRPGEKLSRQSGFLRFGNRKERWFKVAPPSGEFRWMHQRYLKRPDEDVGGPEPELTLATATAATDRADDHSDDHEEIPLQRLGEVSGGMQTVPMAAESAPAENRDVALPPMEEAPNQPPASDVTPQPGPAETEPPSDDAWRVVPVASGMTALETDGPPREGPGDLNAVSLALSRTVVQDISRWHLEPLQAQARQLIDRATTKREQQRALILHRRIREFQAVQRRHEQLQALAGDGQVLAGSPSEVSFDTPPTPPRWSANPARSERVNSRSRWRRY